MRTLLAAAVTLLAFGCGPDDEVAPATPAPEAQKAILETGSPEVIDQTPMRLEVVRTEEGLIFRLVQDPVEERFFVPIDVKQPPPAMPQPPCPTCR